MSDNNVNKDDNKLPPEIAAMLGNNPNIRRVPAKPGDPPMTVRVEYDFGAGAQQQQNPMPPDIECAILRHRVSKLEKDFEMAITSIGYLIRALERNNITVFTTPIFASDLVGADKNKKKDG